MIIIGYHISGNTLANSLGEVITENHLTWLASQPEDTIKLFYDLDWAVTQLARAIGLTQHHVEKLLEKDSLYLPPFGLKYLPHKFLSIKHGFHALAPFAVYTDAKQYLAERVVSDDSTPEYCIDRARQAQVVGQQVSDTLLSIGLSPKTLTSPISAFQKEVLSNLDLPTVDDIPPEAAEIAYECCHGNWVESFQRGHWKQVYDYDISSAYPAQVALLMDTRRGEWIKSAGYAPKAFYGFCRGTVEIEAPFSPIVFSAEDMNYTPTGTWDCSLTKKQIDFIRKYQLGEFRIKEGWWWIPKDLEQPLDYIIKRLYDYKEKNTGLSREVIKRIMSGIWGKFLETRRDEIGDFFNPVWGAEVEVKTQLDVAKFCIENGIMPIAIAVDGVVTDRKVAIPESHAMGAWQLSASCPCLCISSGIVALQSKKNGLDFSLDYDWLIEQAFTNPKATEFTMSKGSYVGLAKALRSWEKLGQLETITKTIDIGYESKRLYSEHPKTAAKLLQRTYLSQPIDISLTQFKATEEKPQNTG